MSNEKWKICLDLLASQFTFPNESHIQSWPYRANAQRVAAHRFAPASYTGIFEAFNVRVSVLFKNQERSTKSH
jgi:hypothetical protein